MGSGKLLASGARKDWFTLVFSIRVCCVAVVFNDKDGAAFFIRPFKVFLRLDLSESES